MLELRHPFSQQKDLNSVLIHGEGNVSELSGSLGLEGVLHRSDPVFGTIPSATPHPRLCYRGCQAVGETGMAQLKSLSSEVPK